MSDDTDTGADLAEALERLARLDSADYDEAAECILANNLDAAEVASYLRAWVHEVAYQPTLFGMRMHVNPRVPPGVLLIDSPMGTADIDAVRSQLVAIGVDPAGHTPILIDESHKLTPGGMIRLPPGSLETIAEDIERMRTRPATCGGCRQWQSFGEDEPGGMCAHDMHPYVKRLVTDAACGDAEAL